jgi:hypothetical protein
MTVLLPYPNGKCAQLTGQDEVVGIVVASIQSIGVIISSIHGSLVVN